MGGDIGGDEESEEKNFASEKYQPAKKKINGSFAKESPRSPLADTAAWLRKRTRTVRMGSKENLSEPSFSFWNRSFSTDGSSAVQGRQSAKTYGAYKPGGDNKKRRGKGV